MIRTIAMKKISAAKATPVIIVAVSSEELSGVSLTKDVAVADREDDDGEGVMNTGFIG
jgi:hypothetical protein